jgi:hypothetical protein
MDDGVNPCSAYILCISPSKQKSREKSLTAQPYAGRVPVLRSFETAVISCAGANGFANMMLFGTPCDAQSSASFPLI